MQNILPVLCFIAGFGLAWLVLRRRSHEVEAAFLELAQGTIAKSQQAARGDLAQVVSPVRESLDRVDSKIQELEKARVGAYATLAGAGAVADRNADAASQRRRGNW